MGVFGGNYFFENMATSDGWLGWFSRKTRLGITIFWGQYYLPIPYKVPVSFVFGEMVKVDKVEKPGKELIDKVFEEYLGNLKAAFDLNKAEAGYLNAELKLM